MVQDKLEVVEKEALKARIESAETRLELLARFDALQQQLAVAQVAKKGL